MSQYDRHVFVCTEGKRCARVGGDEVHAVLKKRVHHELERGHARVNRSGCLGQCGHGPMVVVYPDAVWYAAVDEAGARRIATEHVVGGRVVEKYRYVAPPGDNKID